MCLLNVNAQDADDQTKLYYTSEYSGGFFLHSYGMGGNFRYGQKLGAANTRIYQFEFSTMKHPKEQKVYNPYLNDPKGYVYGKENSFWTFRFSIGKDKEIFGKEIKKGVKVSYVYAAGFTLGFVKPIYYEVATPNLGAPNYTVSSEKFDLEEHSIDRIFGKSGFLVGFNELSLKPGANVKFAFNFEYAAEDALIRALEAGASLDAFPQQIQVLAGEEGSKNLWLGVYINIMFGRKVSS